MKNSVIILVLLLCSLTSFGQSSEDILKMLVEKGMISQEDVDELVEKNKSDQKNVIQKIKTAFTGSDIFKLSGYGQIVYNAIESPPANEPNNSMKVNRAILFATGNIKKYFSYMLMYDFGPKAALHELYGEFTPVTAASLRFGQYKIPFTLENPMSPTRWEGIYGSLSVNALAGISTDIIGAKAGRDMGLQLSGKLFKKGDFFNIEYSAGLFNGTGFNTPDNNNHKDFAGTLIYQPIKGLKLAGSIYSGKAYYASSIGGEPQKNHVRNRWSAGGEYDSQHAYARAEYLYGNDGGVDRNGYYGIGMWKILPQKLDIFGKYDYYNPHKDTESSKITELTGGINFYFSFLSRIQLNYIHTDNKLIGTNNMVATQLQLFF